MKKEYICVGGPLNGKYAGRDDFLQDRWQTVDWKDPTNKIFVPGGKCAKYQREYLPFNGGSRNGITSMIWVHVSCLQKPRTARK